MKLWVYTICHNEAPMLAYFLRHYAPLADKVVLYDDHSDDGGPALAAAYANVEVRAYPGNGLDDLRFVEFAAETYPEARGQADWVIWVDTDEFVYHPYLLGTLGRYMAESVTLPLTAGYAMYAPEFPTGPGQIYDEVKTGMPYAAYSKPCVFNPALTLRWHAGKHGLLNDDNAKRSQAAELKVLHYRHLGAAWFEGRNHRNYTRMTPENIARQHGFQVYDENQPLYGWEPQQAAFTALREVI